MRGCIVGASGKLGKNMGGLALGRGHEVVAVCREESVTQPPGFDSQITIVPGATDDRDVIQRAVAGCDGVLAVLVPRGVHGYASGTAQAVLDYAEPEARLVFSCGWHITVDGQDVYTWKLKALVNIGGRPAPLGRLSGPAAPDKATRPAFATHTPPAPVPGGHFGGGARPGPPP